MRAAHLQREDVLSVLDAVAELAEGHRTRELVARDELVEDLRGRTGVARASTAGVHIAIGKHIGTHIGAHISAHVGMCVDFHTGRRRGHERGDGQADLGRARVDLAVGRAGDAPCHGVRTEQPHPRAAVARIPRREAPRQLHADAAQRSQP